MKKLKLLSKSKEFNKKRKPLQLKRIPNFFYYKNFLYISMIYGQFLTTLEPYDVIYMVIIFFFSHKKKKN